MGKIKAYKHNGNLIPVALARVCTAYSCPWTGKLFDHKQSYIRHLRRLQQNKRDQRRATRHTELISKLHNDWIHQPDLKSIVEWVEQNPDFFFERLKYRVKNSDQITAARSKFNLRITYLSVNYMDCVSNSHHAPRDGITNWIKDDSKPRGYPGWSGRIEFVTGGHHSTFGSDVFRSTGIHTGTGGSLGNGHYGFSVNIFASDWPGLESQMLLDVLANQPPKSFEWGTPKYFARFC